MRARPRIVMSFVLAASIAASAAEVPDQFFLGMNLGGIADWGTEPVWKDLVKQSRPWTAQREGSPWGQGGPLALDSLNWISSLDPDQRAEAPLLGGANSDWSPTIPESTYLCLYDGTGELGFFNAESVNEVSPGRIEVRTSGNNTPWLNLMSTDPNDYIRNIRFVRSDYEDNYLAEPWDPDFVDRWHQFPVIRFMDWQSTNGSAVRTWADRTTMDNHTQALGNGVALEYMIDYCNRTNSHPWFCMPHMADDDYVRNFAIMVRDQLAPHLISYLEYSNECWNYMFPQTVYCDSMGQAMDLAPDDPGWVDGWRYFSQRSVEIFDIWEGVFGSTDRFARVMGAFTAIPSQSEAKLTWNNAYEKVDALAVAPYFSIHDQLNRLDEIASWTVDQILDSCLENIQGSGRQGIEDNIALLERLNTQHGTSMKLIAYEGGQHLTAHGGSDDVTALFTAANRHPRMKDLYITYFEQWAELGGSLFAHFSSMGEPGIWGSFSVLEYPGQTRETAPKYDALLDLIDRFPPPDTYLATEKRSLKPTSVPRLSVSIARERGALRVTTQSDAHVSLVNSAGRLVASCRTKARTSTPLGSALATGTYLVRVRANGQGTNRRVVLW